MDINTINLRVMGDERGSLIALEQNRNIPFDIKRVYYIFGTKKDIRRGFHAHRNLKQVLIAVNGSCNILLDDGYETKEVILDKPNTGLYLESLVWREMFNFSSNCVLMVLTNEYYNEEDYIRNYDLFLENVKRQTNLSLR